MRALTTNEIDRELDSRTKEVAAMSATLLELEDHPGLKRVRLYPPTGVTDMAGNSLDGNGDGTAQGPGVGSKFYFTLPLSRRGAP